MSAARAFLRRMFAESARLWRRQQPIVLVTVTINGLPDLIGWGAEWEVPFDG